MELCHSALIDTVPSLPPPVDPIFIVALECKSESISIYEVFDINQKQRGSALASGLIVRVSSNFRA